MIRNGQSDRGGADVGGEISSIGPSQGGAPGLPIGRMSCRLRGLLVGLLLVCSVRAADAAELRVELILSPTSSEPVAVAFEITSPDGVVVRRGEATAPGSLALTGLPSPPWTVAVSAPGLWSVPVAVERGESASTAVHIWPAATLNAVARVPAGVALPISIAARIDFGGSDVRGRRTASSGIETATATCPIDAKGRLSCQLPRLRGVDLRLRAPGFASRFLWDLDLERSPVFDAGTIELRPGASVIGWVEVPPGFELDATLVRLAPAPQSPYPDPQDERVDRGREVTDVPDVRGFLSFEGLRAGTYTLRATHPDLAEVMLSPIRVFEGAQSRIDEPIVLEPPTPLKLVVDPPFDPYDGDWRLELVRMTDSALRRSAPVASGATAAGYFEAPAVAPGRYEVRVDDSRGVRLAYVEVTATAANEVHQIEMETVRVEGSVRLADNPLVAELTFRGSSRIVMESDAEGSFAGYLPHGGSWDVEVRAAVPPLRFRERAMEVEVEDGRASLEIVLPDTRLGGIVVDEAGKPQHRAVVTVEDASGTGRSVSMATEVDGEFQFHGLPERRHSVRAASAGELTSAVHEVDLREGSDPRLTLVLRRMQSLRGRIVDPSGTPLPDVWLEIQTHTASGHVDLDQGGTVTTDLGGAFEIVVAESSATAHLVILAPGHALRQITAPIRDLGDLAVAPDGGTLVVELPSEIPWTDPTPLRPALLDGAGHKLFLGFFAQWSRLHGVAIEPGMRQFVVPSLSPGSYAVCWMGPEELMQRGSAGRDCDRGELTAGGMLQLRLRPLPAPAGDSANASP